MTNTNYFSIFNVNNTKLKINEFKKDENFIIWYATFKIIESMNHNRRQKLINMLDTSLSTYIHRVILNQVPDVSSLT